MKLQTFWWLSEKKNATIETYTAKELFFRRGEVFGHKQIQPIWELTCFLIIQEMRQ